MKMDQFDWIEVNQVALLFARPNYSESYEGVLDFSSASGPIGRQRGIWQVGVDTAPHNAVSHRFVVLSAIARIIGVWPVSGTGPF